MNEPAPSPADVIAIGAGPLRLEDVDRLAHRRARATLGEPPELRARWAAGAEVIATRIRDGVPTYGVNTGFGGASGNAVPGALAQELASNLPRYHGCGVGPLLAPEQARAVLVTRLASLVQGVSGVRPLLIDSLFGLLAHDVVPCIPARGSVGASGDLTPLAYVALALAGEGRVNARGEITDARRALSDVGQLPLVLAPKESLAIMNGTSVMTALAALAFVRARRVARLAAALTANAVQAVAGQASHYDERIADAKPHAGQRLAMQWIRADLGVGPRPAQRTGRIQDRYSLRCAPHVIGTLLDALTFARGVLETELNGASDNPLVDATTGDVLHGGNFYGGHVALVADTLKIAVASVAELMERQIVLLADPHANGGLPANLVARTGDDRFAHHGFKAMEITASALTAEALKLTMPATAFSRSTEGHNQDKVSMGTIAARDLLTIVELTESVGAVAVLAGCQAIELRGRPAAGPGPRALLATVRPRVAAVDADRPMDGDVELVRGLVTSGALTDAIEGTRTP